MKKTKIFTFTGDRPAVREKITEQDIAALPSVVQKYLRYTNIVGKEKIKTVRLKQGGGFRLKPERDFKNMKAVQYFNVDSMEFYWRGKISVITATDRFIDGKGDLTVKLLGFIRVAHAEGLKVDQGEILRFLAEGVWFPSVFVNDYIRWQAIDDRAARATITRDGLSASATFFFNKENQVERILAERYMDKDGKFELATWEIQIKEYKAFNGVMIPSLSHVVWKLDSGDFCYYKPEIFSIDYNVPLPY
ncbi:MAG: hypothetical protein GXO76_04070 [Calditrichaeota bacterium]|nr:hypothetical protein [Calditrichota bacterium]